MPNAGIPSIEELNRMPEAQRASLLKQLREEYKDVELRRTWSISQNQLYKLLKSVGLPKYKREPFMAYGTVANNAQALSVPEVVAATVEKVIPQSPLHDVPATRKHNSVLINIEGTFSGETLAKKLEGLARFLESSGGSYNLNLKLGHVDLAD